MRHDEQIGAWIWALQTAAGANMSVLTGALGRRLAFKRNTTPEATCDLDLAHDDAALINIAIAEAQDGGMPVLRCFRVESVASDDSIVAVCRFAGPILPLQEDTGDDSTMSLTARGAFEYLEGRFVGEAPDPPWIAELMDAGDIAVDLIVEQDALQTVFMEIGAIEPTTDRDVEYDNKRVADAIVELSQFEDGFDFEVVPIADASGGGATLGRFEVYAFQGTLAERAKFGYGEGTLDNCASASRVTTRPVNRVRVYGDEGYYGEAEDFTSQAKYGIWADTDSMSGVIDTELLDARAAELLHGEPVRVVSFKPNADAQNCPQVWGDYWLGDSVELVVRDGAFAYEGKPRVDAITIDIGDDGFEAEHDITISE